MPMPTYIEKYRWVVFTLQQSDEWRPRFESWGDGDDGRVTIRMFGKEFVYSAEWSKYPPEAHPPYEPLRDAPREIAKYLRKKLNREEKKDKGWRGLLARVNLFFTGLERTYCDGCKKFSRGDICPYC